MKRFALFFALLVALAGCAGSPPVQAPAPETRPAAEPPDPPAVRQAEPEPEPTPAPGFGAPDRWWLLDPELDGVPGIGARRAYAELLAGREPARTVVVAIIDSGVDVAHEALRDRVWVNEGERPGTGRDDDGNGYVDDVHGWNFIGGPDGRNVERDTYEVARLKAACRANGARGPPPGVGTCDEIREAYEKKVQETHEMVEQIRNIGMAVNYYYGLLRAHLGGEALTVERVQSIRTTRPDIQQAREIYLMLAADGISQEDIAEELERLEGLMEYGLNPDFDPRDIVGDDYEDVTERFYGNPDVRGPDASHGTHVAGIVAAAPLDGTGAEGIAPGVAVRIMSIRAVPDGDERDKDVANAIRYAVDNGAHIINMSFGKPFSPYKEAVDAAVRHADANGVLMIHAAGNDGQDVDHAPNFPNRYYADGDTARLWIEVGASAWQGGDALVASFSNYGRERVDVFAPGHNIRSPVPDGEYRTNSGTSMAAPVVSGLAALLMAYYPELDAAAVRRIILDSAARYPDELVQRPGGEDGDLVPFGELSRTGGIVNAYQAVRMAEELVPAGARR